MASVASGTKAVIVVVNRTDLDLFKEVDTPESRFGAAADTVTCVSAPVKSNLVNVVCHDHHHLRSAMSCSTGHVAHLPHPSLLRRHHWDQHRIRQLAQDSRQPAARGGPPGHEEAHAG
jgi:hypothetical protein